MRIIKITALLCSIITSVFFASCTYYGEKRDVAFVYAIGIGEKDGKFAAYFLKSAEQNKETAQNTETNARESVKDTKTVYLECEKTYGKNAEEAFGEFYEKYGDVYINSANIYIFSKDVSGETIYGFGKYLVNSNKLPLKRDVLICEDIEGFFLNCAGSFDAKGFEKACAEAEDSGNIVHFLSAYPQKTDSFPKEAYFSDGKIKIKGKDT